MCKTRIFCLLVALVWPAYGHGQERVFSMSQPALTQPTLLFGYPLKAGDRIVSEYSQFDVLSGNIEDTSREYRLAMCALKNIGLALPRSRQGVYWANFGAEDYELYGYTVDWFSFAGVRKSYTLINKRYRGIHQSDCEQRQHFVDFFVTVYHEVKGHNHDGNQHEEFEESQAFDEEYERPVLERLESVSMCNLVRICSSKN